MDSGPQQASESQERQDGRNSSHFGLAAESAPLLLSGSYALFAIYVFGCIIDLLPVQLLNPFWILAAGSSLVNAAMLPIAGLIFAHTAGALAPIDTRIHQRRRLLSRLAAWAALGFLLLIPALGWAAWWGGSSLDKAIDRQALHRQRDNVDHELQSTLLADEQQQQLARWTSPQLPAFHQDSSLSFYRAACRSMALSLICAIAFSALAFDQLKGQTLLESLIKPRRIAPLRSYGNDLGLGRIFSPLWRLLKPDSVTADRQRFLAQLKAKQKRDSEMRARDRKRNADNVRKQQRAREQKRLLEERRRKRQERRDS